MECCEEAFIVASCKPWHLSGFTQLACQHKGTWKWVTTPDELEEAVLACTPRYIFFMHWNWRVAEHVYSKYECVCFHMTDVPYGRGGSPLQNLILQGCSETKLTALRMVEEMDAGPVYIKCPLSLDGAAQEIYERAGLLSFQIIRWMVEVLPIPSDQEGEPTVFKRRKPEQSHLPKVGDSKSIYNFIRMLDADGYPLAFIEYGEMRIELANAVCEGNDVRANVRISFEAKND